MMNGNTVVLARCPVATPKIAITMDEALLRDLDLWVREGRYPNRSKAVQAAVREKVARWKRTRLAEALAKVDPREEQAEADVYLAGEVFWGEDE